MVYVVVPDFKVSTKDAYESVNHYSHGPIQVADLKDRQTWRDVLQNDFEPNLFLKHPFYKALKTNLYDQGAILACLTGSGSAFVALFEEKMNLKLPIKGTWHSFI